MVIYITLADISPKTKTDDSAQPRNAQLSFLGERVGSGHKTKTANSAYTNKATHLCVPNDAHPTPHCLSVTTLPSTSHDKAAK
jgi:hypothetical protein